ncbi:MAG: hypothetical protein Q8862_10540 [Bacteroidota bacterium]|nr:hypothetical protein [Bacteroidota bacterium]MDP4205484.1 hypothetical protein [Bacteroidota bacterium]
MGRKEFNEHLEELLTIRKYILGLNNTDQLFIENSKEQLLIDVEKKIQDLKRGVFSGFNSASLN